MNFNCGLILPNHDTCVGMTMCRLVRVPLVCHFGSRALDLQPWHVIPCRWGRGKSARARLLVSHLAFPGFCFRSSDWRPHLALGWQVKAVVCFQEIPRDSPLGEVDQQSAVVLAPSQGHSNSKAAPADLRRGATSFTRAQHEELGNIQDIDGCVDDDLRTALLAALGEPQRVREIALAGLPQTPGAPLRPVGGGTPGASHLRKLKLTGVLIGGMLETEVAERCNSYTKRDLVTSPRQTRTCRKTSSWLCHRSFRPGLRPFQTSVCSGRLAKGCCVDRRTRHSSSCRDR